MAHKKAGGSSHNGRDSQGQRLGVKKYAGEIVKAGNIIIRQHGTHIHAGDNVGTGRDYTLYALTPGTVKFSQRTKTSRKVSVEPAVEPVA